MDDFPCRKPELIQWASLSIGQVWKAFSVTLMGTSLNICHAAF